MNNFIIQLKNDLRINKRNLINPIILFIIIDVLAILAYFIFKHNTGMSYEDLMTITMDADLGANLGEFPRLLWTTAGMGVVSFVGLIMVILSLSLNSSALNLDNFRKCEIFYRSQPISVWQYAGSRYLVGIFAPLAIMIAVGLFNLVLVIPFLAPLVGFEFLPSLHGLFSSIFIYFRSMLVLGSLSFLASAIFREKAFMKMLLFFIAVQVMFVFAHFSLDVPMVDIFGYLIKLINPLQNFTKVSGIANMESLDGVYSFLSMRNIMFNWHCLLQVISSAVFFVSGVFIYSRKEVN